MNDAIYFSPSLKKSSMFLTAHVIQQHLFLKATVPQTLPGCVGAVLSGRHMMAHMSTLFSWSKDDREWISSLVPSASAEATHQVELLFFFIMKAALHKYFEYGCVFPKCCFVKGSESSSEHFNKLTGIKLKEWLCFFKFNRNWETLYVKHESLWKQTLIHLL